MCTLTLVVPFDPVPYDLLALGAGQDKGDCYLDQQQLVWHSNGYYYSFSYHTRELVLDTVTDFNPLIGCKPLPLETALSRLAMASVDRLEIKHKPYHLPAICGPRLLKMLRNRLNNGYYVSPWAVKNYFGPVPYRKFHGHYRKIIALAEQALLEPEKILVLAQERECQHQRSLLVIDHQGAAFKCMLTSTMLRITQAAPPSSFCIHNFRNAEIRITVHCLDRFTTRILGRSSGAINAIVAEAELLRFIKNRAVNHSFLMGRTILVNVEGCNFVGALSRQGLTLVTVYRQTLVDREVFHNQILALLDP